MQYALRSWSVLCRTRTRWVANQNSSRRLKSSWSLAEVFETVKVVCGSAGSIDVDLYNTSALLNPSNPLIIYLPPTGVHLRTIQPQIPSNLFHPTASLAAINYRWNIPSPPSSSPAAPSPKLLSTHPSFATHPFPTPLHDTLHAYTYLLTSLLPKYSAPPSPDNSLTFARRTLYSSTPAIKTIQRPLLIYGRYLGGTLATSLALTESFASKQLPTRIAGLIAVNGIYDWTDIATSIPPSQNQEHSPSSTAEAEKRPWANGWNSETLYGLREKLFASPSSAFDSFASPMLFFRTAGIAVPKIWPTDQENPTSTSPSPPSSISNTQDEDIFHATSDPSLVTDVDMSISTGSNGATKGKYGGEIELEVSRAAHLKYPPKDSGLKIPRSLFLYTPSPPPPPTSPPSSKRKSMKREDRDSEEVSANVQAEEMVKLMRRSVQLHEFKDRVLWDDDADPGGAAAERVALCALDGEVEEGTVVREWIEEVLDS